MFGPIAAAIFSPPGRSGTEGAFNRVALAPTEPEWPGLRADDWKEQQYQERWTERHDGTMVFRYRMGPVGPSFESLKALVSDVMARDIATHALFGPLMSWVSETKDQRPVIVLRKRADLKPAVAIHDRRERYDGLPVVFLSSELDQMTRAQVVDTVAHEMLHVVVTVGGCVGTPPDSTIDAAYQLHAALTDVVEEELFVRNVVLRALEGSGGEMSYLETLHRRLDQMIDEEAAFAGTVRETTRCELPEELSLDRSTHRYPRARLGPATRDSLLGKLGVIRRALERRAVR